MQVCRDAARNGLESGFIAMRKRSVDATRHQADVRVHHTVAGVLGPAYGVQDINGNGACHGVDPQLGRSLRIALLQTDGDVYMTGYGADLETVKQIVGTGDILGGFGYALLTRIGRGIREERHGAAVDATT